MSWRVAWIMARLAVLMVLNSPAPMRAEQLRVNLCNAPLVRGGVIARNHMLCARQSILRIRHTPLSDEQGAPRVSQRFQLLGSCRFGHLRCNDEADI